MWFWTCKIHDVENPRRKIRSFRHVENHVSYVTYVTDPTLLARGETLLSDFGHFGWLWSDHGRRIYGRSTKSQVPNLGEGDKPTVRGCCDAVPCIRNALRFCAKP